MEQTNPGVMSAVLTPPKPRPLQTWALWCRFLEDLRKLPDGLENPHACTRLQQRLLRFSNTHTADPAAIKKVTAAIYRAVPLLQSALGWEEPTVGGTTEKRSTTDRRRGEQWRLVLAFSGFETMAKALLSQKGRGGIGADAFCKLLTDCTLPVYVPLAVPEHKESLLDEWFCSDAQEELLDFLGLDYGDANITASWLVQRKPMATWVQGLCLAKALRNATVHGALSASKVDQWKLACSIRRLVDDIALVAGAVLDRLTVAEAG